MRPDSAQCVPISDSLLQNKGPAVAHVQSVGTSLIEVSAVILKLNMSKEGLSHALWATQNISLAMDLPLKLCTCH